MGQSAVLEIGNGRMRHLSAVFFLSTFVVSSISIFPDVFAQESETVLQVSGSARFEESDYAGSCKSAVAAARWNAAKLVLSDYIKTSTEDDETMLPIRAAFENQVSDYVLAEIVLSEEVSSGLLLVTIRVKLNERRLVADGRHGIQ